MGRITNSGYEQLTAKRKEKESPTDDALSAGRILVAFEKLFGGGRGVRKFSRSGLRYVNLPGEAMLVEQNPNKRSEWAKLATGGHRIAWVMREGEYLGRVIDGEIVMFEGRE
jgi:hypothetical protein